jgi:hypothetical protein
MIMGDNDFSLCANAILPFIFDYLVVDAQRDLGYSYLCGPVGEEGA